MSRSSEIYFCRIFTEDEERLSYVINLQETNHEYEEEEELYLNKKVNAIIEDKKQACYSSLIWETPNMLIWGMVTLFYLRYIS